MSLILRDPLVRQLLYDDLGAGPSTSLLYPRPLRVRRATGPNELRVNAFDHALNELQGVINSVNEAIGNYQTSLTSDLQAGAMRTSRTENGNLQVAADVSQFKPEEVSVKLCEDNLVIEAKTETSENNNYHKAELKRWFKLPADVKHEAITSTLTPDGKLLIEVPVNKPIAESLSRTIPIQVQPEAKKDEQAAAKELQNDSKTAGDQQGAQDACCRKK